MKREPTNEELRKMERDLEKEGCADFEAAKKWREKKDAEFKEFMASLLED